MFSCYFNECPTGFKVYALSSNGKKEIICNFDEEIVSRRFMHQTGNLECSSSSYYSNFLLMQTKLTNNYTNVFSFYYLELFGELYNTNEIYETSRFIYFGFVSIVFLPLSVFIEIS